MEDPNDIKHIKISKSMFSKDQFIRLSQISEESLAFNLWLGTMMVKTYGEYDYATLMHAFRTEKDERSKMISSEDSNHLDSDTIKSQVSADIGATGEKYVENIINKVYMASNTSKKGRKGDLTVIRTENDTCRILVEVKTYTKTVHSAEVDKFYRDIEANQSIKGAIFVSLNTQIVGIKGNFVFKEVYKGRNIPVVFVCSNSENIILSALEVVWAHADYKDIVSQKSFSKIGKRVADLSEILDGLSEARTHISETRVVLEKQLTRIYDTIISSEVRLDRAVNELRSTIADDFGESHIIPLESEDTDKRLQLIADKYVDTIYTEDDGFRKIINQILSKCMDNHLLASHKKSKIKAICSDKNVTFVLVLKYDKKTKKDLCEEFLILKILKTRMDISIKLPIEEKTNIKIPKFGSYKDGWITFELDKKYNKTGICENIIKWIT